MLNDASQILNTNIDPYVQYTKEQIADTPVNINPNSVMHRRCETTDGIPVDPRQLVAAEFTGRARRIVVNSAGIIVNAGTKQRLFTGPLRDAIKAINPTCSWLGCTLRATISQIDHITPHSHGGPTNTANADTVCKHHNIHKHLGNYQPRFNTDGTYQLHKPDGSRLKPPDAA